MGFVAVPIKFPVLPDHPCQAGRSAAVPQCRSAAATQDAGGMRIQMTNPQPQPLRSLPFSSSESALRLAPVSEPPADVSLQDEIRLLRERGLSDDCIHGLFSGFNIDANPEPSGQHWNLPANDQLIGLIWGRTPSTH